MSKEERYTLEFRNNAVLLAETSENIADVARDLGIPYRKLMNWVITHRRRVARGENTEVAKQLKAEMAAKDRRIAALEEENEILKKAAAYLANGLR